MNARIDFGQPELWSPDSWFPFRMGLRKASAWDAYQESVPIVRMVGLMFASNWVIRKSNNQWRSSHVSMLKAFVCSTFCLCPYKLLCQATALIN